MKEWSREERYRVLKSKEEIVDVHKRNAASVYRQSYHIQPVSGLSSDPNGFIYHKGIWHLFYQWTPWGAVHGLKYWYHVTSTDLVHWKNEGIGLAPDCDYDNKGCHSGSGFAYGDDMYLFYTGNHRDENWVRTPYTCVAQYTPEGLKKMPSPLFGPRDDYAEHQRDPKVVYVKEKDMYFIFIGAMSEDKRGTTLIYKSSSLLEGWSFAGELKVPGYEHFGGMWECPCIANIDGKDVFVFSPQYTTLEGRGNSTNHNVYLVGKMDYDTLTFTPETDYRYLDYGFDFYAAQMAANVNDDKKAIMITWIGLPDNHYPTEEEDYEGSMTIARELRLKGNRIVQSPVKAIEQLREECDEEEGKLSKAMEMIVDFNEGDASLHLFTKENGEGGFTIDYNANTKTITVDKSHMDKRFNEHVFETLDVPLDEDLKNMRIFIDSSSVEIFINDGLYTFTAHVYPTEKECGYTHSDNVSMSRYKLKASVKDDFVV